MRYPLTSRERITRAIHHEAVDRVPVTPFGLGQLEYDDVLARQLIVTTDPFLPVGLGGTIFTGKHFAERVSAHTDEGDVVWQINTPRSILAQRYRRIGESGYTVEFPCRSGDDVAEYLRIPFEPEEPDASHFRSLRQIYGDTAFVIADIPDAVSFLGEILSPTDFSLLWADQPDFVRTVVTRAQERLLVFVEKACRTGVDAFRITGAEYVTRQFGPEAYNALCRDQDKELVDALHRHDALAYYHVHGDVNQYLEPFASLGIDILDPVEAAPYGDVDLADAKRRIGADVCLVGGVDDLELVDQPDAGAVRDAGRACLEACGTIGYCLGGTASGAYGPDGARNFIALVDVAQEFGSG